MKGFVVAEQGHVVNVISPQNITGGVTGQAFSMADYQHVSLLLLLGAQASAATKIILNACTDASGDSPTAIPFSIYKQETAGNSHDVLGARTAVAASGYTPTGNANTFYVIELDAAELPQGSPYLQVEVTNGSNADYFAVVAVLSGARYAEVQSPTVCV
jgi:hypothetical protein